MSELKLGQAIGWAFYETWLPRQPINIDRTDPDRDRVWCAHIRLFVKICRGEYPALKLVMLEFYAGMLGVAFWVLLKTAREMQFGQYHPTDPQGNPLDLTQRPFPDYLFA